MQISNSRRGWFDVIAVKQTRALPASAVRCSVVRRCRWLRVGRRRARSRSSAPRHISVVWSSHSPQEPWQEVDRIIAEVSWREESTQRRHIHCRDSKATGCGCGEPHEWWRPRGCVQWTPPLGIARGECHPRLPGAKRSINAGGDVNIGYVRAETRL